MLTGFTLTLIVSAAEACDASLSYILHDISHQAASVATVMDVAIYSVLPLQNRQSRSKKKKETTVLLAFTQENWKKAPIKHKLSLHAGSLM